ncbi:MAG: heme lyase CcmF/NrfE family subunit [Candidatus Eisenbacteria bacterium]|uniref:Heme lyase CcmF/NrfE family subunit n=1 Tax=Eiseniibacteriota bacterium TaxID=2212470 RepID=A0A956N9D2_UNCEI|nr:heme lyase CcmF/NrfE family subunit [Candidatus Eisenbacteria bacterium]MCB9463038.1 heme lyase CcmF/NrfE family subunit [Candidatus Eisenbacteria bacterium]
MIQLGYYALWGALGSAAFALVFSVLAFRGGREDLQTSARHATWAAAFFTTVACAGIVYAFLMGDYQMEYVWGNSDRDMPTFYKLGALWGGQSGSLLFWGWLLSMYTALVGLRHRKDHVRLMAPTTTTLMSVLVFFLALVLFGTNPFRRADFIPPDGVGLNPLLQHPAMVIHPPCLYLGMIGFTVPFAFAVGALVSGRLDNDWLKKARLWAVVAWLFLGAGNILGGWWAYLELGWGGYWAWDPVENASFMPWLAGTAYIHSAMIQERKQMLKIWNMVLILSTFVLTVMGTFITRSGLISSVHSFAQSNIGYYFAGFLLASIVVSLGLIIWRRNELKSQQHLDSYLSRESAFLFGNLILLGGAFAVLWGTLFPMFTEAIKGNRISLGPPFFNQFMIPVGLGILFLMGVGPLIPWRRASWSGLSKVFTVPAGLLLAAVAVLLIFGVTHAYALVTFGFCAFVTGTIFTEFKQGIQARMRSQGENPIAAFFRLFTKGQRRYGGYIVHLGVVIIFIGFAGAAFTQESETTLGRGETWHFRNYALTYRGLAVEQTPSVERISADVLLAKNDHNVAVMKPRKDWYQKNQQLASEVAIHATLGADLYLILASFDEKADRASLKLYWNPLVSWYWIGGLVMVLGGILVLLPLRRRQLT